MEWYVARTNEIAPFGYYLAPFRFSHQGIYLAPNIPQHFDIQSQRLGYVSRTNHITAFLKGYQGTKNDINHKFWANFDKCNSLWPSREHRQLRSRFIGI